MSNSNNHIEKIYEVVQNGSKYEIIITIKQNGVQVEKYLYRTLNDKLDAYTVIKNLKNYGTLFLDENDKFKGD